MENRDLFRKITEMYQADPSKVEENIRLTEAAEGMTFGEFKERCIANYKSVFPASGCTVRPGTIGVDNSFFVTYYLAGNTSEFINGISENDLFNIRFYIDEIRENRYDYEGGNELTDDTILPQNLVMEVSYNTILTKPENKYMAYNSRLLPFRKTKGTPEKILDTLKKYATVTKNVLTELYNSDMIPEDRKEFVASKLSENLERKTETKKLTEDEYSDTLINAIENTDGMEATVETLKDMLQEIKKIESYYLAMDEDITLAIDDMFNSDSNPSYCIRWLYSAIEDTLDALKK